MGWDTRKTEDKKKKKKEFRESKIRKTRSRGKIYFCNKDSSSPGAVSTEQLNHQMCRLVKRKSPGESDGGSLSLATGSHLPSSGSGPRGWHCRLEGGKGAGSLETNPAAGPVGGTKVPSLGSGAPRIPVCIFVWWTHMCS